MVWYLAPKGNESRWIWGWEFNLLPVCGCICISASWLLSNGSHYPCVWMCLWMLTCSVKVLWVVRMTINELLKCSAFTLFSPYLLFLFFCIVMGCLLIQHGVGEKSWSRSSKEQTRKSRGSRKCKKRSSRFICLRDMEIMNIMLRFILLNWRPESVARVSELRWHLTFLFTLFTYLCWRGVFWFFVFFL